MYCKYCRYYKTHHNYTQFKTCTHETVTHGYGDNKPVENGIHVEYDEGWGIIVGPMFGCINYEPL